ncbi:MAG TPA: hypothetical protein VI540_02490 [Gaiellaceae bacterium]|nr:hypothetical protein [Gaiellaceae bacterium]
MSREGGKRESAEPTGGTPIWVWLVYGLGILAAIIVAGSVLFTAGAFVASDDVPATLSISVLGIVLWGGLIVLAVATWLTRRRGARR